MEIAKRNIHILYRRHVRPILRRMSLTADGSDPSHEKSTFVFPEQDLALPLGSLILVTGATGYIASHIINELLILGYRVRGTVRSEEKGASMKKAFNDDANFETVVVADLTDAHGFDKAVEGCDGVIHAASVVNFSPDPNEVIPATVAGATNVLRSAVKAGSVKRVVYTSSSVAATMPILDTEFKIGKETWNDTTVEKVKAMKEPYKPEGAMEVYGASKTEAEKAVWKFVQEEEPGFVVNCVLPNANFGRILSVKGFTASIAPGVLKGEFDMMLPPQWFVDVQDDARVHVAALIDKTVKDERIFAFARAFDWNDMFDAVRKARPEAKTIPERLPPHGKDLSEVNNADGPLLLSKWFSQTTWKSLEDIIRENLEGQD